MKLLIFSDIHNDWKALEKLLSIEADYYIAAGDQTSWARGLESCGEILATRGERVYVLPGNHESTANIKDLCERYGLNNLHQSHFQAGSWQVAGLGYSSPTPFHTPGEYSETEIAERLERFTGLEPMVLVCHCPPYGTALDRVKEGVHAGSRSVRDFIERHQPGWFFCGHIHEAEGEHAQMGATRAFNVGKKGYLLELD